MTRKCSRNNSIIKPSLKSNGGWEIITQIRQADRIERLASGIIIRDLKHCCQTGFWWENFIFFLTMHFWAIMICHSLWDPLHAREVYTGIHEQPVITQLRSSFWCMYYLRSIFWCSTCSSYSSVSTSHCCSWNAGSFTRSNSCNDQ